MSNAKTDKARLFKGVFIGVRERPYNKVFEDIVDLLEEKGVEECLHGGRGHTGTNLSR